ncbi:peptide deformylase [Ructibacterium gallinarum]|uniref:Peptide deformylase n=1 Tax=Ructibacterium gallinarum TaxID=2779355 RepID=A0A9D5LZG4_9FIRM|nr:peptide deformylase [Ructibacterium gallinarum]MBE5039787.1 peptide deformylase [Ructibacterium gallinarum]
MAIRKILTVGDPVLTKKCRTIENIDQRTLTLLDDLADTLYESGGVGLAAPQVGVLRRAVVIDIGDGLIELINPEIIQTDGEQTDAEGCLSYPGKFGLVTRPNRVTVRAMDRNGTIRELTGEGLLARAFCHELDHLDGKMFMNLVTEWLEDEDE